MLAHVAVDEEGRLLVELVDVAIEHALDVEGVDGEGIQTREDVELVVDEKVDGGVEARGNETNRRNLRARTE